MNKLQERLKAQAGSKLPVASEQKGPAGMPALPVAPARTDTDGVDDVLKSIAGIEVEAIVGGALQRITFRPETDPYCVAGMLRILDPNMQVRTEWPRKGGGPRDTKTARAIVINVRVNDNGKFIDIVGQNGDDISISVSKKSADTFLDSLKSLGKLKDGHLAKVEKAFTSKASATVILDAEEQFGVSYWTTDDGRAFMEAMTPDAPAVQGATAGSNSHE